MIHDLNHFHMIGRLTRDCENKTGRNDSVICKFSIAVHRKRKNESGSYEQDVSFFDLCLFGKAAVGLSPYLKKGQLVAVSGSLYQNRWEQDGQSRSQIALNVTEVELLPSNHSGKKQNTASEEPEDEMNYQSEDSNIPEEIY